MLLVFTLFEALKLTVFTPVVACNIPPVAILNVKFVVLILGPVIVPLMLRFVKFNKEPVAVVKFKLDVFTPVVAFNIPPVAILNVKFVVLILGPVIVPLMLRFVKFSREPVAVVKFKLNVFTPVVACNIPPVAILNIKFVVLILGPVIVPLMLRFVKFNKEPVAVVKFKLDVFTPVVIYNRPPVAILNVKLDVLISVPVIDPLMLRFVKFNKEPVAILNVKLDVIVFVPVAVVYCK
jgi:hypothetical protein